MHLLISIAHGMLAIFTEDKVMYNGFVTSDNAQDSAKVQWNIYSSRDQAGMFLKKLSCDLENKTCYLEINPPSQPPLIFIFCFFVPDAWDA